MRAIAGHWPFVALLVLGLALRAGSSSGLGGPQLGGLVAAAAVYAVAVRWGCWRWLSAVAAVPALLDARTLPDQGLAGSVASLLLAAALVVTCWRARPHPLLWAAGAGCLIVALLVGRHATTATGASGWDVRVPVVLLVVLLLVALAAAAGLGRANGAPPLRVVCALTGLAPLALLLAERSAGVATSAQDVPAVVWWPGAAALGLTALLRGRRGRATLRPQADDVDEAAAAAFTARYGELRLPPVAIVIAAYNEADGIPGVLAALPTEVCGLATEVLVVDDGSSDPTAAALDGTRARVVACPANRGQGAALRLGYRLAREHGARYVVTTDADGQYDVADIPTVLQPILDDRADFVTGSRILGHQHTHDRVRRTGVHVFSRLAGLLTGRRLTDTSFGLRAMRAELTAVVTLNQPQYQASELLLGVLSHGYRVLEVPGTMHVRSAGATKKGRNLVYGSRYARVMTGTWLREGCPRPVTEVAPALRNTRGHAAG